MMEEDSNEKTEEDNEKTIDEERTELFIVQLKIVALNSRIDAMTQRQQALGAESSIIAIKQPQAEKERQELLADYQPRYEELKTKLEVPKGHEINLETGEVVASPTK